MGLRSIFLSALPLIVSGVLAPQLAVAAVTVEVNDKEGETLCDGDLVNMSTTTDKVTVGMDGNCGAGIGNLSSSAISMGSVDEGASKSMSILNGVTLTPPVSVQLDTANPPMNGAVVTLNAASNLTYDVSYTAAYVDVDTLDSFGVSITDSSNPPQSATLTFDVNVAALAAPPPGSGCTPSSTIVCKSDLNLTVNGEQYAVPIDLNTTHVWRITPENRNSYGSFSFNYFSNVMTVSISDRYDANSTVDYCTKDVGAGSLYYNESNVYGQCHIDPNKTYFFRISSPKSGRYSIFY